MKKSIALLISALTLSFSSAHAAGMKLTSKTIKDKGTMTEDQVFNGFGCSGKNISPDLEWTGAPPATKAFAVTMYDPDAPTGSGWWHWVIFNIPPTTTHLEANAGSGGQLPPGAVQSRTDFGKPGYGGPCPPPGKPHHYIFTVYALKEPLSLDENSPAAMVGFYLNQNKLASAKLTALYGR